MPTFLIRESSTADLYLLQAGNEDRCYRIFARDILKLPGTDDPNFDTGNVDIDLILLPAVATTPQSIIFAD